MIPENMLKNSGPQLTIEELDAFAREYNVSLPEDYKEFLLIYNGGYEDRGTGDARRELSYGKEGEGGIAEFFGLYPPSEDLPSDLRSMCNCTWEWLPRHLFPIADNGCGDRVCLSLAPEDYGRVYTCLHDVPWPDNWEYVAASFSEFASSLHYIVNDIGGSAS